MLNQFETIEEFSVHSEIADTTVRIRLRRKVHYKPTRFSRGPFWLDLHAGSVHVPYYGVDEQVAKEAAARFLLKHISGIAPSVH